MRSPSGEHLRAAQAARLEAARSSLRRARVESERAGRELERRRGAEQIFSAEQIELAEFQLQLAELDRERLEAALAEAEAVMSRVESDERRGRVRAPFDGVVSGRYALPGTVLEAGQPVLRLVATSRPVVRFAVPARDVVDHFSIGTVVRAEVNGSDAAGPAVVENISPVLDEASQLIFVEAGADGPVWDGIPVGAVLRVAAADSDSCRGQPVDLTPG